MKELQEIIRICEDNPGETFALATVFKVQGSHYRQPGARLLMTRERVVAGSISAGCLEQDLLAHAQPVMDSGEPTVIVYDTSSDDDIMWGLNLGCGGEVHILVEKLPSFEESHLGLLKSCVVDRDPASVALVTRVDGTPGVKPGDRLMRTQEEVAATGGNGRGLREMVDGDMHEVIRQARSTLRTCQAPDGTAEIFLEYLAPVLRLVICGAGADAVPIMRFARELGWQVVVVDHRAELATTERLPEADEIILARPEAVAAELQIDDRTAVVILTHNWHHDLELLKTFVSSPARYLGLLGSRPRSSSLFEQMRSEGIELTPEQLQKIHSPAGVDIGGESPEEIALSIVAEVKAVFSDRTGGLLKDRKDPLHE